MSCTQLKERQTGGEANDESLKGSIWVNAYWRRLFWRLDHEVGLDGSGSQVHMLKSDQVILFTNQTSLIAGSAFSSFTARRRIRDGIREYGVCGNTPTV